MNPDKEAVLREVAERQPLFEQMRAEIGRTIVGQHYLVRRLLVAILADGHILLEGVPGLAKTLAVHTVAQTIGCSFQRIQFTPDLLPADVLGTEIFDPRSGEFRIKQGPIFHALVLADEINRAPAKVQSALLEAMQERQVSIGGHTFQLAQPFLVLATQNPIEQEGTYPLPEAQIDRFMLKVVVTYPERDEELQIVQLTTQGTMPIPRQIAGPDEILRARETVFRVHVAEKLQRYIVDLVQATRRPSEFGLDIGPWIEYGASPRASIYLTLAAKAHAFLEGRADVYPEDVKAIALDVMRHRVILNYEAEAEDITSEALVQQVLSHVKVP